MAIYVSNKIDKNFLETTLKECYLGYLRTVLFNDKFNKDAVALMNKYLTDNYNIDLHMLFKAVVDNIQITTQGDNYKLTLNEFNIITKNCSLGMLMRLVDYGNTEIRGLHLFDKVEKYIQKRLNAIFTLHTLKGMN